MMGFMISMQVLNESTQQAFTCSKQCHGVFVVGFGQI